MGDTNLVFAGKFGEFLKDFLYLLREYVYALNLHHVVSSAGDDVKAWMVAAAGAVPRDDTAKVMGSVADKRRTFLYQGGDNNLSPLPVWNWLQCLWVDYLNVDIVIPVVHTVFPKAAHADARAVNLGKSVDIVKLNSKL